MQKNKSAADATNGVLAKWNDRTCVVLCSFTQSYQYTR